MQGGVGRNATFSAHDFIQPGHPDAKGLRELVYAHAQWNEVVFLDRFFGMWWFDHRSFDALRWPPAIAAVIRSGLASQNSASSFSDLNSGRSGTTVLTSSRSVSSS